MQSKLNDYVINPHSKRDKETQQIFYHFENFVMRLKRIFENLKKEIIIKRKLFKLKKLNLVITYASRFQTLTYKLD